MFALAKELCAPARERVRKDGCLLLHGVCYVDYVVALAAY